MAALNFPTTGLVAGVTQYTSDLGTTYIWDGVKWVGHSAGGAVGTNSISNNGHTVQVDAGGNLVLPAFAMPNTVGTTGQVLKWPAGGSTLFWANDNNSNTYSNANVASYLVANPQSGTYSNANVASYLVANPQSGTYSNANVAAYLTGNITAGNITTGNVRATQYNFANGVNILSTVTSGSPANTGNFTFSADTIINNNGLILATDRGNLAIGTNMEGIGAAGHLHIAFDGSNNTPPGADLFLGDDYNYVKLPGGSDPEYYGVEIGTYDRQGGNNHVWRFGTDGNLSLPQGSRISDQATSVDLTVGRVSESAYWYNLFGDTGATTYANVAINGSVVHDAGGNVYVLGSTTGVNFNNNNNLFLKYSPLGELLWRRTWTDSSGLSCGSYNASLRYIEANVVLGTQDTILWAAQTPNNRISYVGTMDMEGNMVDLFGDARLPVRLDNFAVTDLEWATDAGVPYVLVVGQLYVPGAGPIPDHNYPALAGVDLDTATIAGDGTVVPAGTDLTVGLYSAKPWANMFKALTVLPPVGPAPSILAVVGSYYDGSHTHAMVTLSADGPGLTVGIGVDNHGSDDVIGEDICCDANGNVYVIVNNISSNYAVVLCGTEGSIESGSALWQRRIGDLSGSDSFYATAVTYSSGHVYVLGQFYQDNIEDTDVMLIKLNKYTGNIVWSRRIGSPGEDGLSIAGFPPGWSSSSGIHVQDGLIVISFATEARTKNVNLYGQDLNTVTLQYPQDGSLLGTFGDFEITDFEPAIGSIDYSITTLTTTGGEIPFTTGFATLQATTAAVGTGWTNTQWDLDQNREVYPTQTFKFMTDGTFDTPEIKHVGEVRITAAVAPTINEPTPSTWAFQNNDGLRFPDGSVQYGAYVETEMALDGGFAGTVFNIIPRPTIADGGGSSARHGAADPVYDGNDSNNYVLDGGGA
jgi:hypothetical protein